MATARKLKSGSWRVLQYDYTDDSGKRHYESFTADTKWDAELLAAQAKKAATAQKRAKKAESLTIGAAVDQYITSKDGILSPSTVALYKRIKRTSMEAICSLQIERISQEDVQKWMNAIAKRLSPKSCRNAHGLLSAVLAECAPDFTLRTKLPQKIKPRISIPTDAEIKILKQESEGTQMETVYLLAAMLGLRRSEICALTWADFGTEKNTMSVSKAVVEDDSGKWVTKTTKSYSGTRTIEVPSALAEHLIKIKGKDLANEKIITLVPGSVSNSFNTLRNKLGFSFRFHDLRHYYASKLLALGVPDKYAMQRMGHATTNMLKTVYQHIMDDKEKEVSALIQGSMNKLLK